MTPFHDFFPAGIIEAVASEFFDNEVTMVVLNQSEDDKRTGKKEHVVFLVKQINKAFKTGDQDDSNDRGVGDCRFLCMVSFYMYMYCIYYVYF